MKHKKKFSIYDLPMLTIVFFIAGLVLMSYGAIGVHEEAHKNIYGYYGIESNIHYNSYGIPYEVQAEKPCPISTNCRLSQDLVDIVGYQLVPIYMILFLAFAFIILILEEGFIKNGNK